MKLSLSPSELVAYVQRQFNQFFPDHGNLGDLSRFVDRALERVEHCFSNIRIKNFSDAEGAHFHHLHTDQYAIFLYYLSNTAFRIAGRHPVAQKAYALNKTLHALDIFYEVELPDVVLFSHPVGTVLGRAKYEDFFCCYQNCTTGANLENVYPTIGRGVVMYGGSRVIGNTQIGNNTFVATGACVIDSPDLPANSIVYGTFPNVDAAPTTRNVIRDIFKSEDS